MKGKCVSVSSKFSCSLSAGKRCELCSTLKLRLKGELRHYAGVRGGSGEGNRVGVKGLQWDISFSSREFLSQTSAELCC